MCLFVYVLGSCEKNAGLLHLLLLTFHRTCTFGTHNNTGNALQYELVCFISFPDLVEVCSRLFSFSQIYQLVLLVRFLDYWEECFQS